MSAETGTFAGDGVMDSISTFLYPALRLVVAGLVVWFSADGSK
jgi:hypothetical protein